ncbi:MAG TPA: DUF2726 domain-containing protein [Steroidobacteraceae bacterium]|nr:DUF2726 domain-containing protein [Steroidobacteraceae bacterium]
MRPEAPWIALAGLLLLALAIAALVGRRRRRRDRLSAPWPLEVRSRLLSERELALFRRLIHSLPEHIVLAQVQLLQVLEFWPGGRTQALVNRISRLSIDFLIVNADTSVVAAIELDDVTHRRRGRPWADARKTHALKSAGVPLIRWNARKLPDEAAIRAAVLSVAAQQRP